MGRGGRWTVVLVMAVLVTVGVCLLARHLLRPQRKEAPELMEELVRYCRQGPESSLIDRALGRIWFAVPSARPVVDKVWPERRGLREVMRDLRQTGPSGAAFLREQLRHEDPLWRWLATAALSGMGDSREADAIAPLIDDPNSKVRIAAIIGLTRLWGPGARDALVAKLRDTTDRTEIEYAAAGSDPGGLFPRLRFELKDGLEEAGRGETAEATQSANPQMPASPSDGAAPCKSG